MTIADAFNEITIAQGGTPNYSGTIAAAIDALNDTLAGSDQPADPTIEGAVRLLGQHIGGGGGGTEYAITCTKGGEPVSSYVYKAIWDAGTSAYIKDPDSPTLDKAAAGEPLFVELDEGYAAQIYDEHTPFAWVFRDSPMFYMPSSAATIDAVED